MEIDKFEDNICLKAIKAGVEVSLHHAETNIQITDHIAQIDFIQYYMNKSSELEEMEFVQPVHAKVVFANFEIEVGGKTLVSQVRTTKEAEIIYSDNVSAGKTAGMSRYARNT